MLDDIDVYSQILHLRRITGQRHHIEESTERGRFLNYFQSINSSNIEEHIINSNTINHFYLKDNHIIFRLRGPANFNTRYNCQIKTSYIYQHRKSIEHVLREHFTNIGFQDIRLYFHKSFGTIDYVDLLVCSTDILNSHTYSSNNKSITRKILRKLTINNPFSSEINLL